MWYPECTPSLYPVFRDKLEIHSIPEMDKLFQQEQAIQ